MPPVGFIDIDIVGSERGIQSMLKRLDTATNPAAIAVLLTNVVAPYLSKRAKARFAGEGDDVTGQWAPLEASTQDFRRRGREQQLWTVGDAHPINQRSGQLRRYMTEGYEHAYPHMLGATLMYPRRTAPSRKSLRQKLETAQRGRVHPNTVPRPVMGLNEQDLLFVLTAIAFSIKGVNP